MKKITLLFLTIVIFLFACERRSSLVNSSAPDPRIRYESIEIFLTYDEIFQNSEIENRIYDFDLDLNDLFYHNSDSTGILNYNFNSKETNELVDYISSTVIAQDSIYLFYNDSNSIIQRYNLELKMTDVKIDITNIGNKTIAGLEIYKNILYVLVRYDPDGLVHLVKYDLNGNYLASVKYVRFTPRITIANDILYSIDPYDELISRYDLNSNRFLQSKRLPAKDCGAFRIFQDKFYFIDKEKQFLGVMPLSEIED